MDSTTAPQKSTRLFLIICVVCLIAVSFIWKALLVPPTDFPVPVTITVTSGESLTTLSQNLIESRLISSPQLFQAIVITFGGERSISEGEYYFDHPVGVFEVAQRFSGHSFGIARTKVTFPEGFSIADMSTRLTQNIPLFDTKTFISLTEGKEGYLFPDTYHFFPHVTAEAVARELEQTFIAKTASLKSQAAKEGKDWKDVVIMASIVEREATANDRAIVAGILWKRLERGMPLQADATIRYVFPENTDTVTKAELSIDSPYNTYKYKGLPPTPICNPGLKALEASLHPATTEYWYYLHDKDGQIHYASTYKEHQKNINTYLK